MGSITSLQSQVIRSVISTSMSGYSGCGSSNVQSISMIPAPIIFISATLSGRQELTFFPWPAAHRRARGAGDVESTAFAIPPRSVGYWLERLKEYHVSAERMPERFGQEVIRLLDTDGMLLELIASKSSDEVQPWIEGPVPAEHSIRGLHGVIWIPETILFLLNMRRKQVLAGPVFVAVSGQILPVIAINAIEIERFDNHHACRG